MYKTFYYLILSYRYTFVLIQCMQNTNYNNIDDFKDPNNYTCVHLFNAI